MDIKVSRNYAAYQKAVSNAKHTEKSLSAPVQAAGKARGDAICISSEGVKKSGVSSFSAALSRSMEEGAPADRIAAIKQQVQEGDIPGAGRADCQAPYERSVGGENIGRNH